MKLLVLLLATACYGSTVYVLPALPYSTVGTSPIILHALSQSPAVTRIGKPGITFRAPTPVQYFAPIHVAAPVQYAAPAPVATQVRTFQVAAPGQYAAPAPAATQVQTFQVATPGQYAAPTPVVVAAAPEPLLAPDPPLPSVGEPFVGGQFHAQDEAGQYSFAHWGGPNTRVETRDFLGRTSGSFAYVNPDGDVEVRKYGASPATGFRVAASDLPADTPKVS
ncbi:uncharacterized protein [Procambarus clarkii]|uniref:uncharacterized protein n=1 Tax=Procambarus clarkii TaxID=6728 RepID=UPI0037435A9F